MSHDAPPTEPVRTEPASAEDDEGQRLGTPFLVLQFFVFPMSIVAVCVAVFVVFGLIASEGRGAREYLDEVRTGSANRRWQAAFELSKVLQAGKDPALKDPRFAAELTALFRESEKDDPRVRRYLALALGRLGRKEAVPPLLEALAPAGPNAPPPDAETQVYAVWALGSIGDSAALPELVRLARSEDAGLRKAAVHALGVYAQPEAGEALRAALGDARPDVRWNAALALARRRDGAAVPEVARMLDRAQLTAVPEATPEQVDSVLQQAIAAAAALRAPELRAPLQVLAREEKNLKLREAASRAVESIP